VKQWRQQQYKQAAQGNASSAQGYGCGKAGTSKEKYKITNQLETRATALRSIKAW